MKRLVTILTLVVLSLTCLGGNLSSRTVRIPTDTGRMKVKLLQPKQTDAPVPGILWIHGGGFMVGGTYMLGMTCGKMLAEKYGAVLFQTFP